MKANKKQDRKRKIAAAVAIFLAFLMILSAIAPFIMAAEPSASSGLTIKAEAGYSGLYKVGYPVPVRVEITNNSNAVSGEVLINVPKSNDYYGYGSQSETDYISYSYPITMNESSTEIINMDIMIDTIVVSNELKVEFVDAKGKVLTESIISSVAIDPESILVGSLSDNPESLSYIRAIYIDEFMENLSGSAKKIVNFDASGFPESMEALSAFNVLYINDFDTSRLSNLSISALNSWISNGGILFVGTGENFNKVAKGLSNITKIEKTGEIETDDLDMVFSLIDERALYSDIGNEDEMNRVMVSSGYKPNSTIAMPAATPEPIVEEGEDKEADKSYSNPYSYEKSTVSPVYYTSFSLNDDENDRDQLVKSIAIGAGKLIVLGFDLGNNPISKSLRVNELIRQLAINEVDMFRIRDNLYSSSGYLAYSHALSLIPTQNTGTIKLVYVFIITYVAVIGPVLYLILKKRDKREAGFIIIPAMAAVLTISIFAISFNTVYKKPVLNSVSKTVLYNGSQLAAKMGNIVAMSGRKGDINVEIGGSGIKVDMIRDSGRYGYYGYYNNGSNSMKIVQGDNPKMVFKDSERWQANMFSTTEEIDFGGTIDCEISMNNGVYEGVITNNSPYDLNDIILVFGNTGAKNVGKLGSGEVLEINQPVDVVTRSGYYDSYELLWGDYENYEDDAIENWNKMIRQSMMDMQLNNDYYYGSRSSYYSQQTYNNFDMNTQVRMYAFIEDEIGGISASVNGSQPVMLSNSMIQSDFDCPVNLDGYFELPFGYITPSSIASQGYYDVDATGGYYVYQAGDMEFGFNISYFNDLSSFQFDSALGTDDEGRAVESSIFNFDKNEWETLKFAEYKKPLQYFDKEGNLKIKVDCANSYWISAPWITVKGER